MVMTPSLVMDASNSFRTRPDMYLSHLNRQDYISSILGKQPRVVKESQSLRQTIPKKLQGVLNYAHAL